VPAGASTGNIVVTVGGQTSTEAVVQATSQASFGTANPSVSISSSTAGNTLIVLPGMPDGTTVTSVTDNIGNSWVQVPNAYSTSAGDGFAVDIWYCANCAGGVTTVTAHFPASASFAGLIAYEVSGITTTSPLDLGAHVSEAAVSGGNCNGPSVTTSSTDFLIAAGDADHGFSGVSIPWVFGDEAQEGYVLNAAPGTYQPIFQAGSGSTHCLVSLAAFKNTPGSSGVASNGVLFQVGSGGATGTPNVSAISPISGSIGTPIMITGTNFGSTQGTSTVKFNGVTAVPTSWSNTSIAVTVPSGATTGNVVVTVAGHSSGEAIIQGQGQVATGTAAPSITISPSIAGDTLIFLPAIPYGMTITSVIDNIGNTWIQAPNARATSAGDGYATDIWYCANCAAGVTSVTAHLSASAGFVSLEVYEMSGIFTTSPLELGAHASEGTVSGGNCTGPSVTTSSTDFLIAQGDADHGYSGVSAPWVFGDGQQEGYILTAAPGTYQPIFQAGAGSTHCLESLAAFKIVPTSFTVITPPPPPSITSLSPNSGPVGTSVTITGTNFGSTQGTSTVTFNGVTATPTSWSATSIVAPVPSGATTGSVVVTVSGVSTTGTHTFTVVPPPTISGLSPSSGIAGTPVTITGTNFGSTQGTSTVTFNGATAAASSWSNTSIAVTVPSGSITGNVVVTVSGVSTSGTHTFTVQASPTISGMSPSAGGVGTAVTITGTNLGTTGTVAFNGTPATVWSWSPTLIVAPVPIGASSGSVVVTASGVQLPAAGSFTVNSSVPSTATEYSYDSMGRVAQTMTCTPMNCGTGQGSLMTYSYDLAGNLTTLTSNGTSIQYSPVDSPIDTAGHVTKVESGWVDGTHPAVLATVDPSNGYWPTGALRKITYGNNLTESSVYNSQGQPCRISVNSSGALLSNCSDALPSGNVQDFSVSYGPSDNGNIAGFTASGQQNFNRSYTYDSLNRLQSMSAPGDQCSGLSWTVDPWGNRTAQTNTGGSCYSPQVSVDTNNRILGDSYDVAGNLLSDGNHTYTYDAESRVTQVDGGNTATYVYDPSGNRVEKTVGGTDSQYLYDANGQINTVFGNGVFQRMYVYLGSKQLAEYFNNTTFFPLTDHLGSTRLLTGLDGSVQESDDYYPYGEPITTGTQSLLKFTGKERDTESGLDNFGARYYGSSMGRFMTPDWAARPTTVPYAVFGDPQSLNLYGYVRNDPISQADADGHISEEAACPDPHGCSPDKKNNPNPMPPGKTQSDKIQSGNANGTTVTITTFDVRKLTLSSEKRTGTHAFRDNNPGNIRKGKFATKNGAIGKDGGFAIFPNSEAGFNALGNLLGTPSYQSLTLDQAINRYAPPSENDTSTYQSAIRDATGVSGDTSMSSLNSVQIGNMEQGIAQHEGFFVPGTVETQSIDLYMILMTAIQ